jgi:hypothetical protein
LAIDVDVLAIRPALVTSVPPVTLPNHYAKCPPRSDFSATSWGVMTGEVLWLKSRCEAAEHTVPRALRAAADHALSPTGPAAATAPPRSFCATESLNTTVRALPPGRRQWDSQ